jgi:hypothetical protein
MWEMCYRAGVTRAIEAAWTHSSFVIVASVLKKEASIDDLLKQLRRIIAILVIVIAASRLS